MELRHLRYFVAVAEGENISRAALRLHVSQPALSRQINDLEDELDVLLFERSPKSVRLTEAGRLFLGEARAVLERADAAVKAVRNASGGAHTELHVGYAPSLTVQILPGTLRRFQTDFPKVRVLLHDLSTEEMRTRLLQGKLQLALMVPPSAKEARGLQVETLARYPMCIAVSRQHPLASLTRITREQASREAFVAYTRPDYPDYHELLRELFGAGIKIVEEHDSGASLIAAVESGRGTALVPSCMTSFAGERLAVIPLSPAPKPLVIAAVYRKEPPSTALGNFIAAAKQASRNAERAALPPRRE